MNKRILFLAFISAVFFFSCSADGSFSYPDNPPPAWDKLPICSEEVGQLANNCNNY